MENEVNIIHDPNVLTLTEDPYVSIQGEAQYVGIPMLFVRIQGCPVGCDWCDSYYTWYPYRKSEIPEGIPAPILAKVKNSPEFRARENSEQDSYADAFGESAPF